MTRNATYRLVSSQKYLTDEAAYKIRVLFRVRYFWYIISLLVKVSADTFDE